MPGDITLAYHIQYLQVQCRKRAVEALSNFDLQSLPMRKLLIHLLAVLTAVVTWMRPMQAQDRLEDLSVPQKLVGSALVTPPILYMVVGLTNAKAGYLWGRAPENLEIICQSGRNLYADLRMLFAPVSQHHRFINSIRLEPQQQNLPLIMTVEGCEPCDSVTMSIDGKPVLIKNDEKNLASLQSSVCVLDMTGRLHSGTNKVVVDVTGGPIGVILWTLSTPKVDLEPARSDTVSIWEECVQKYERRYGSADQFLATCLTMLGNAYFEKGRFVQAESAFKRALAIRDHEDLQSINYPEAGDIFDFLADVYKKQGRTEEMKALQNSASLKKEETRLRHFVAETSYDGSVYGQNLYVGTLYQLAEFYRQHERYDRAEPLYRRALEIRRSLPPKYKYDRGGIDELLRGLGIVAAKHGQLEQSQQLFKESLAEQTPYGGHTVVTNLDLAIVYFKLDKLAEAQAAYNRAKSIYGHIPDWCKSDFSEDDYARMLSEALRSNPDYAPLYADRGFWYLLSKQYEKALADFDKAICLAPESHSDFYLNRAKVYSQLGLTELAAKDRAKHYALRSKEELRCRYPTDQQAVAQGELVIQLLHSSMPDRQDRLNRLSGTRVAFFGSGPAPGGGPNLLVDNQTVVEVVLDPMANIKRGWTITGAGTRWTASVLGILKSVDSRKKVIYVQARPADWHSSVGQ